MFQMLPQCLGIFQLYEPGIDIVLFIWAKYCTKIVSRYASLFTS